jgi:dipeptidyl aminopeptidase/acylaminoacyl peptidase
MACWSSNDVETRRHPVGIETSVRYREIGDRVRAMLEPGLGKPSSFPEIELAPDGRRIAAICRIADSLEGEPRTELWLFDLEASTHRSLTAPDGNATSPRWLPDGRSIAFLADHGHRHRMTPRIATIDQVGPPGGADGKLAPGAKGRAPGAAPAHGVRELPSPPGVAEHLRVSPDGTRLALVMAGDAAEQADGLGSGTVGQNLERERPDWFPEVETSEATDAWRSAWVVDVASGDARRVSPDGLNTWEAGWLGDEALVAVVSDDPAEDAWYGSRLVRLEAGPEVDADDPPEPILLYEPEWQIQFAEGSPDGSRVAVIEAVASDRYFVEGDLVIASADGSGARSPGWLGADLSIVRWDGPGTLVAAGIAGFEHLIMRLAADGEPSPVELLRSAGQMRLPFGGMAAGGGRVAVALTGPDRPDRLALVEDGAERLVLGTDHQGHDLIRSAIAERRIEQWSAPDGTRIQGLLVLPHGEPPFATMLWIHGGPVGAAGGAFLASTIATFVEAGYAVVFPNPRGSTGRGRDFAAVVVGDTGGPYDTGDLLSSMDHLVKIGIADPKRLVCAGASYGGYMSALLPAIDDRFAAALVMSPLTDLISSYYGSSLTKFVDAFVGGRPDEEPQRYLARSSVFAGTGLQTPSLITAGALDRATPPGQAMEHFRALREQGTPAELVIYPKEGHGVRRIEAALDWTARLVMWSERFAPPRP